MIYKMLGSTFYYGEFEYPKGSGKWYKGNHPPLITKELFMKVQKQLKVPIKPKWGSKVFPYKRFLKCYSCGASVVGEEKIRKNRTGTHKFVYYHCSRQVNHDCTEPFVREEIIVKELVSMCDELITDTADLEPGLRNALDKFALMMRATHKGYGKKNMVSGYVKYVLQEGSEFEKTRLVRNLNIKLALHDKKLVQI